MLNTIMTLAMLFRYETSLFRYHTNLVNMYEHNQITLNCKFIHWFTYRLNRRPKTNLGYLHTSASPHALKLCGIVIVFPRDYHLIHSINFPMLRKEQSEMLVTFSFLQDIGYIAKLPGFLSKWRDKNNASLHDLQNVSGLCTWYWVRFQDAAI